MMDIIGKKILCLNRLYFLLLKGTSLLEGRTSLNEVKHDIRSNFIVLYLADCLVFIPVQMVNFKFISAFYRVPFMFGISFFFNLFMSAYKHAHKEEENHDE